MSATNLTKNLKLSQFLASDKPSWLGDVNGDNKKIDDGYGVLAGEISKANDTASSAKSQSDANTQTLTNVNSELEDYGNRITALESGGGTEQLEQRVNTLSTDVEALQTRADTLEGETEQNGTNISSLTNRVTTLEPKVQTNADNITSLQTTSESLLGSVASLTKKIDSTTVTANTALDTAKRAEQNGVTNSNSILSINATLGGKTDVRMSTNQLSSGGLNCIYSKASKVGIVFGGVYPSTDSLVVTDVESKLCDVLFNQSGIEFVGSTLVSNPVTFNGITFTLKGSLSNAYITIKNSNSNTTYMNPMSAIPAITFATV